MKIVADENIPVLDHYFGLYGELILKNGRDIKKADLMDADLLIIRSITPVNRQLLEGTPVKFVGSVASGVDHLDISWLEAAGIYYRTAYGCNAIAVVNYVIACIAALQKMDLLSKDKIRAGVIGVGQIGNQVVQQFRALNFDLLLCDPPRYCLENDFKHTPIEEFSDLDLITVHTPLTQDGQYPTYHLIDQHFLSRQKKECVLLNASRGAVINFNDLKLYGGELIWCLDVWENEPFIDLNILDRAVIGTPHIAGHSLQSKYRAVNAVYEGAIQYGILPEKKQDSIAYPRKDFSFLNEQPDWRDVVLKIFDPRETTELLKKQMTEDGRYAFDELRNCFNKTEFSYANLIDLTTDETNKEFLKMLGFVI